MLAGALHFEREREEQAAASDGERTQELEKSGRQASSSEKEREAGRQRARLLQTVQKSDLSGTSVSASELLEAATRATRFKLTVCEK